MASSILISFLLYFHKPPTANLPLHLCCHDSSGSDGENQDRKCNTTMGGGPSPFPLLVIYLAYSQPSQPAKRPFPNSPASTRN
ncbi:hypothetical protein F5Y17DRAFT_429163 [Xylariaceae sp. FL0594]|nr:hypothetical protein F5Y17DRAFT_429163 [Xylariaceae sp. FL0594]